MLIMYRYKIYYAIFVLSILTFSILGSSASEHSDVVKLYNLPIFLSNFFGFLYVLLLSYFWILGFIYLKKLKKIPTTYIFLILAYFCLFLWSLVTLSDVVRYFLIFSCVVFCPFGLLVILEKVDFSRISFGVYVAIAILIFVSIIYSILNLSTHPRVSGIHTNPNLMGGWLLSILCLTLYFEKNQNKIIIIFFVLIIFLLILFTGSRLVFICSLLFVLPFFARSKFSLFIILFVLMLFIILNINLFPNSDFRFLEIKNSVSDSGRSEIWERAINCIQMSPLVGHGMFGSHNCVSIGNVHNSYLRVAVMLGIPLTVIFFSLYLIFIVMVFFKSKSYYLKYFFLGLPLLFFGEDYVVGFASPFFAFLILVLSLLLYDLKKKDNV